MKVWTEDEVYWGNRADLILPSACESRADEAKVAMAADWFQGHCPRISLIVWLAVHDELPTEVRIAGQFF